MISRIANICIIISQSNQYKNNTLLIMTLNLCEYYDYTNTRFDTKDESIAR